MPRPATSSSIVSKDRLATGTVMVAGRVFVDHLVLRHDGGVGEHLAAALGGNYVGELALLWTHIGGAVHG